MFGFNVFTATSTRSCQVAEIKYYKISIRIKKSIQCWPNLILLYSKMAQSSLTNKYFQNIYLLTFPHFSKVAGSQFFDEVDLRPWNFVLVSGGILQGVALALSGLGLGARFGQLATEAFAISTLVAGHQVLQRVECLSRCDKISPAKKGQLSFYYNRLRT